MEYMKTDNNITVSNTEIKYKKTSDKNKQEKKNRGEFRCKS